MKINRKNFFKKKSVASQLEIIGDEIKKGSELSLLEKFSAIASIAGFIIGVILSVWAIILTQKYGEDKEQIKKLSSIAENQDKQIEKLVEIVSDLKKQNDLTQEQNTELRSQGVLLNDQAKTVSEQFKLGLKQQKENFTTSQTKKKSDLYQLRNLIAKFGGIRCGVVKEEIRKVGKSSSVEFFYQAERLIEEVTKNDLVVQNDSLMKKYRELKGMLYVLIGDFNLSSESKKVAKTTDNKVVLTRDVMDYEKWDGDFQSNFIDRFLEFYYALIDYKDKIKSQLKVY